MIRKITTLIGAGVISGLMTSITPGAAPNATTEAALRNGSPAPVVNAIVVDRTNKGDRLPVRYRPSDSSHSEGRAPKTVPLGCDSAFGRVADPAAAHIFKRCMP